MLEIRRTDVNSADARAMLAELDGALERLTGSSGQGSFSPEDVRQTGAMFAVAYWDGTPIACGGFRPLTEITAEIKRVYARSNRVGAAAQLLTHLERQAAAMGYTEAVLETRRVNTHAVAFYLRCGYEAGPVYGRYAGRPEAVCFRKRLSP